LCYNRRDMKRLHRAFIAASLALVPLAAQAQLKLLPPCATSSDTKIAGNCSISDILVVFGNLAEFLLGIVGAVALGYFVYGGFVFILSRGNKAEVDKAFGILRSAAIGVFIIFLSGVFVRFTIQALTGGTSAIPTIGESCNSGTKKSVAPGDKTADGLWVLMPEGINQDGSVQPQRLTCIKKETSATKAGAPCQNLNAALEGLQRSERYTCIDVNKATTSCVRGLCSQLTSEFACCLTPGAK
jgi:type IV secretion system pilin